MPVLKTVIKKYSDLLISCHVNSQTKHWKRQPFICILLWLFVMEISYLYVLLLIKFVRLNRVT